MAKYIAHFGSRAGSEIQRDIRAAGSSVGGKQLRDAQLLEQLIADYNQFGWLNQINQKLIGKGAYADLATVAEVLAIRGLRGTQIGGAINLAISAAQLYDQWGDNTAAAGVVVRPWGWAGWDLIQQWDPFPSGGGNNVAPYGDPAGDYHLLNGIVNRGPYSLPAVDGPIPPAAVRVGYLQGRTKTAYGTHPGYTEMIWTKSGGSTVPSLASQVVQLGTALGVRRFAPVVRAQPKPLDSPWPGAQVDQAGEPSSSVQQPPTYVGGQPGAPPAIQIVPGPETAPKIDFVPPEHTYTRPPRGTRERKTILHMHPARFAMRLISAVTNGKEVVDCMYSAMPKILRKREYRRFLNHGTGSRTRLLPQEKAEFVWTYLPQMDMGEFAQCMVANEIEDRFWAAPAKHLRPLYNAGGFSHGVQTGPGLSGGRDNARPNVSGNVSDFMDWLAKQVEGL